MEKQLDKLTDKELKEEWAKNVPTKETINRWRKLSDMSGNAREDVDDTRLALERACNAIELLLKDVREYHALYGQLPAKN